MGIKVFLNCFLLALFLILAALFYHPTFAQTSNCGSGTTQRAQGLVTAPSLSAGSNFSTSGACIIDPKTAFAPFRIPGFEDLKSLYFDQSKAAKVTLSGDQTGGIDLTVKDKIYYISGNLSLDNPSDIAGNQSGVIFVDGDLTIAPSSNRLTHGTANSGLVFVVGGNVQIGKDVTLVDAVIIAKGIICTAYDGTCPSANIETLQLVINGSLISINQEDSTPIKFRRTLTDNSQPAEKINHQVKYLVILRDLLSDTLQRWSEIP